MGVASNKGANSHSALEKLRQLIEAASIGTERRLPTERDLVSLLGVGRRAVRRALDVLEEEGRVHRHQGRGTFLGAAPPRRFPSPESVSGLSDPLEVMEVRLRLEPALAQLAALRADAEQIRMMRSIAAKIVNADDADGRELWDSVLHRHIAEAAGNRLFLALFDLTDRVRQDPVWLHVRQLARTSNRHLLYGAQHTEIINAIADRNPAAAEAAMRRHLLSLQENLTCVITREFSDAS